MKKILALILSVFCLGTLTVQAASVIPSSDIVGPRGNVPDGAPNDRGFKLFAIPVQNILSRSGQPSLSDFKWLKNNGWKSVVDLRVNKEKKDIAIDTKIPGFNSLGFNYLGLPIKDGGVPSANQVHKFLKFVTNGDNQPSEVHCAAGIGRTGIMVALYRYQIQGWSMNQAIKEANLFTKNLPKSQQQWLRKWAKNHKAGSGA